MNIYSTPAQVRELIAIAARLGLEAKTVRVQYSGGGWDVAPTLPVQLPVEGNAFDIYSVSFTGDESAACNVAATLHQIKTMQMSPSYKAWFVWMQLTGKVIGLEEFKAKLFDQIAEPEIEKILGGK